MVAISPRRHSIGWVSTKETWNGAHAFALVQCLERGGLLGIRPTLGEPNLDDTDPQAQFIQDPSSGGEEV
jgi:hypothetical protein